jgi:hypothetical protein
VCLDDHGYTASVIHFFDVQLSSQLMQTEILRSRTGPVELLSGPFDTFALGGAPVRRVTTTNVVKVRSHIIFYCFEFEAITLCQISVILRDVSRALIIF